jgi:tight adherence protein C
MRTMLLHILPFCAAGLAAAVALDWSQRRTMIRRLRVAAGAPASAGEGHGLAAALAWCGSHVPGANDRAMKTVLMQAGYFAPAALPILLGLRLICTVVIFVLLLLQNGLTIGLEDFLTASFLAFFANRLIVILLKLKAEARQREVRRELPPVIDVMTMVLNGGVSIDQSLRYVAGMVDRAAPRIALVLRRYVAEIDNGVLYETAIERLGQRLGIDEGHDLAALLKQALLQGGEITAALERFGAEASDKRVAAAREQIGRKSTLLTIVMLVFFMPVLLTVLAGPAVWDITDTLATVKLHAAKGAKR